MFFYNRNRSYVVPLCIGLFFVLNVCVASLVRIPKNGGEDLDPPDPLAAARLTVKNIDSVNQPVDEYAEKQPLDVNNNILTNNQGTLQGNDKLYTMSDDPEHQVKDSNPNKFNAYYSEQKIPEPPPLPKMQENPFQTIKEISENADKLDKLSGKEKLLVGENNGGNKR